MGSSVNFPKDKYLRQVALDLAKDLPHETEDARRVIEILTEIVDKLWVCRDGSEVHQLRGGLRD
jgi:hypothetical protein